MNKLVREQVALQQANLISQIMDSENTAKSRFSQGLSVYQNNLLATAKQSLSQTFPTVANQLGDESMLQLARLLLQKQPPYQGDWAEWGVGLPNVLKSLPIAQQYPFIAESARLDLNIHQAERASTKVFEPKSALLLQQHDLDDVCITLQETTHFFSASYPVIEIQGASNHKDLSVSELKTAEQRLCKRLQSGRLSQNVLVYRPEIKTRLIEISDEELSWLTLMAKQVAIGEALTMVSKEFNFPLWLTNAIERNLIVNFFHLEHFQKPIT